MGSPDRFARIEKDDVYEVANLLVDEGARFAGATDRRAITWLCQEAAAGNRNVFVVTAKDDHKTVGAVLAVRREVLLAIGLIRLAPLLAAGALARLAAGAAANIMRHHASRKPNWLTSYGAGAVKVILVATVRGARQRGIGFRLYDMLSDIVHDAGDINWIIARIENANAASIALHGKSGWIVVPEATFVSAWKPVHHAP